MSSFSLCFLNKTYTVIWYLKPLTSFKSNKSLMLDLLDYNPTKGAFESIISIL